jgi:hypothetical protein
LNNKIKTISNKIKSGVKVGKVFTLVFNTFTEDEINNLIRKLAALSPSPLKATFVLSTRRDAEDKLSRIQYPDTTGQ